MPTPTEGGLEILAAIAGAPFVLQSPDGHYWQIGIDNAGALVTTDLGTVAPEGAIVPEPV